MDFLNILPNLVSAFEIKKGSIVLLQFWGDNKDIDFLDKFAIEIAKVGGIPVKHQFSREYLKDYFSQVTNKNLEFPKNYFKVFDLADTIIDICMYTPVIPHKDFPKDKTAAYRNYMKSLFNTVSSSEKNLIQLRVPTEQNAVEAGFKFQVYSETLLAAYNINYSKLKLTSSSLLNKLNNKKSVTITTNEINTLSFELGNRKWFKDDGTGDMPCGEIYIAPIEESANGKILLPIMELGDKSYENVTLEFKNGKVSNSSEKAVLEFFKNVPENADTIGELGIGLNKNVKKLIGLDLTDEKCIGTAHIALGMNIMFGGKNNCPFHADFVFKPDELKIDEIVVIENGVLVI